MADLPEADEFTAGVYQLETTDPVEGGPDGIDNKPAKALTNRTLWLKNALAALATVVNGFTGQINSLTNRVVNLEAFATRKFTYFLARGTVSIGNVVNTKTIEVTFPNIGTSSYIVVGSLVSNSNNQILDTSVIWTVKYNKSATSFTLCVAEVTNYDQNLSFEYFLFPLN